MARKARLMSYPIMSGSAAPGHQRLQRWCAFLLGMTLLASASGAAAQADAQVQRGRAVYESRCVACHSVDSHRVGPAHQGVLGRRAGSAAGYAYSEALRDSRLVWSRTSLAAWLAGPEAVIPGQTMNYSLGDANERADVVAYLATLK